MAELTWQMDQNTVHWAEKINPLAQTSSPKPQYSGNNMTESTWLSKNNNRRFPSYCYHSYGDLFCSPNNIIRCLHDQEYLAGLAMVISWGTMARTMKYIYTKSLIDIEKTISRATRTIDDTKSIYDCWKILTTELGWTNVMTSKFIHFLSRSLGFESNPPVPIDNGVILNNLWPMFYRNCISDTSGIYKPYPQKWDGNRWEDYNRYMSAILTWSQYKKWTTTQIENTLYTLFQ